MINLTEKTVTVIGAQRSGMAVADLVRRLGGHVKVSDAKPAGELPEAVQNQLQQNQIVFETGGHTRSFVQNSDIVVLSPGVRWQSLPVQWAREKGIPVLGEIEFAFQFCPVPVIAVTGSNGKTTVVTLIHEVLREAGLASVLCGNVGRPFSEFVLDLSGKDYVVLEVSSFQMESLLELDSPHRDPMRGETYFKGFKPHIAVFLNFSQNHLDRHQDLNEYFAAKARIFLNQGPEDFAVLNADDKLIKSLESKVISCVNYFSASGHNPNHAVVRRVADILSIDPRCCDRLFSRFKGVEHRLEWVRQIAGIDFINDSKSTTAEASRWALTHIERPVVMICGGRDKNMDFSVLSNLVKAKVKKMLIIGEARPKLKETFGGVVGVEECDQLEQAVLKARESAQDGDCVIFSPMCASYDMFKDFEHRGTAFKEIVKKLN